MASRETSGSASAKEGSNPFFNWGNGRSEAAMALQKAVLESYEQASHAWLTRVQSEITLWSDLASKLGTTHSVPGSTRNLHEVRFATHANGRRRWAPAG